MPSDLETRLRSLAHDLTWSWHEVLQRPFAMLDPVAWEATNHAPIATILHAGNQRVQEAANDPRFMQVLADAETALENAVGAPRWFTGHNAPERTPLHVAYYCSEFAIHESMQQYSGGLGVLAGDHMKSAEDLGVPITGIGLLYRHGYYRQQFETDGRTRVIYPKYDFAEYPIEDTGVLINCPIGAQHVAARIWRLRFGNTSILLLDADLPENSPEDRILTEGLYKGEPELRMRQQVLLGVGGVMALDAMGVNANVHHLNEGHAAFAAIKRVADSVQNGLPLEAAIEYVRNTSVFTTHTPVPAGHDRYEPAAAANAMHQVLAEAGISHESFEDLGRVHPGETNEQVCMTVIALRLARFVNGVAKLHGEVTRDMWKDVYGAEDANDVPIGSVTNGVHPGTWLDPAAAMFWKRAIRLNPNRARPNETTWKKSLDVDREDAWNLRSQLRRRLVGFVRARLANQARESGADPETILQAQNVLCTDALTIGFARRFATYKRSPLVFTDTDRLAKILGDTEQPVQLIFAGKAHPRDKAGQDFARKIHRMSRKDAFQGRVVLLEEYDMRIGRELTSGCDLWLNNPIRPHEASGTSGMKPPMHLGLNCSILDGWWPEGFDGQNGFAIQGRPKGKSARARDLADAHALYELLEEVIIPEFFKRNRRDVPSRWMGRALRAASTIPSQFSSHRMVAQYVDEAYLPALGNA